MPPPPAMPAPPLRVLSFGPQGRSDGSGSFHVRFNQPVGALDLNDEQKDTPQLVIEPPLKGHSYFQSPELLVFERGESPPDATRYRVTLRGPIVAQSGARFEQPLTWEFETPRPKVVSTKPSAGDSEISRTTPLFVHFDNPTRAAEVKAHLQLRAFPIGQLEASARPLPFTVSESTSAEAQLHDLAWEAHNKGVLFTVKPQPLWPVGSEVIVTVTSGLHTTVGSLPLDTPYESRFRTISALKLEAAGCAAVKPCGLEPISLRFNNPIPEAQWKRISISPKPDHFVLAGVDSFSKLGSKEARLAGVWLPDKIYTIHVPADLTDGYGQNLGQSITHQARIARLPTLELHERKGTLSATVKRTIGVVSRYVQALRVRAIVLEDHELAALAQGEPAASAQDAGSDSDEELSSDNSSTKKSDATVFDSFSWPVAGRPQIERTIALSPSGPTSWSSVAIDLGELAAQAKRAIFVEVSAAELIPTVKGPQPMRVRGLYQITNLGPVIVRSPSRSLVLLTRLSTTEPVGGAKVSLLEQKADAVARPLGVTDANGLLELPGAGDDFFTKGKRGGLFVFSEAGSEDRAYLSTSPHGSRDSAFRSRASANPWRYRGLGLGLDRDHFETDKLRPGERLILRIITERDAYLPGELVRVVGWAAIDTPYSRSGLLRPPVGTPVELALKDSHARTLATLRTTTTKEGKFWAELPIPAAGRLGGFMVTATLLEASAHTRLKVEDFRIPEFSVATTVSAADVIAAPDGDSDVTPTVRAAASYYFGGPVKIRRALYHHSCSTVNYRPPGIEYGWAVGDVPSDSRRTPSAITVDLTSARAAADSGRLSFTPSRAQQISGYPNRCVVDVQAGDASYQSYGARTEYMIHPARYYLAVRTPGTSGQGEPLSIPLRAVGHDGQRLTARGVSITVERRWREPLFRLEGGKRIFDREEEKKELVRKSQIDVSNVGADTIYKLTPSQPGNYDILLQGAPSEKAKSARTRTTFHVDAQKELVPPVAPSAPPAPAQRDFELRVSKNQVKPGEALDVTLAAVWPANGMLLLAHNGLREVRPLRLQPNRDLRLPLAVDDSWFPRVNVMALVVHPTSNGLPTIATQAQQVSMLQDHRRLKVQVDAPPVGHAGAKVPITVRVTDDGDRPIAAGDTTRVALWAVDEAVLELSHYQAPELLQSFIPHGGDRLSAYHDFASLLLPYVVAAADPWLAHGWSENGLGSRVGDGPSLVTGSALGGSGKPQVRQKFEITPLFLADVPVGADGTVKVDAKLPDNLTTFRITAIASARLVDGESPGRFGINDARLRVTAPLIVRPALPRSLRPGDQAEAAAIVNNLGGPAGQLTVSVRVFNNDAQSNSSAALKLVGKSETTLSIAAGAVERIPFQLSAERAGRSEVELSAVLIAKEGTGPLRDAVRVPVPIEAERTLIEHVATYGTLSTDQPVAIPLRVPRDADPRQGGMKIEASTSLLGDLSSTARALVSYPYGCVEQTASRILPLLAIAELRQGGYLREEIGDADAFLAAGVQRILDMQTASGGFTYWPGDKSPNPYATAYALWVLKMAQHSQITFSQEALDRAADYLQGLFKDPAVLQDPLQAVHAAIAVHTLSELDRKVPELIEKLYTQRSELPIFGRAFLLMALLRALPGDARTAMLTEELLGSIAELPGSAHVVERVTYNLDSVFHSEARSDAIVLLALLRARPDHPVLVKLVRGLFERRRGAAWRNTQENAYSLLALAEFARRYEKAPPNMTGFAWVGQSLLAQVRLTERTSTVHTALVPMSRLLKPLAAAQPDDALPVILQRTGSGRLYYRVGLEWSARDASPPARAQGLRITRTLRDGTKTLGADDILPAGEPLAFDLELENRAPLHYLAIDIPLPAGLESVQTNLNRNARPMPIAGSHGNFISHQEAWKDRTVLFADQLQPGKHRHTLYLRATTPGRYILPPAHGEAMYTPEVYGRSSGGIVEIR